MFGAAEDLDEHDIGFSQVGTALTIIHDTTCLVCAYWCIEHCAANYGVREAQTDATLHIDRSRAISDPPYIASRLGIELPLSTGVLILRQEKSLTKPYS